MSKTNFINGDAPSGIHGTRVAAEFLNAVNNHHHTGLDEDGHGALPYAADTGTANAYVVNLSPALTQYISGMSIYFKVANANTGSSTININNLGPKTITRNNGQALAAGDIRTGEIVLAVYDGVNFRLMGSFAADAGAVGGKVPGVANGIATLDTNLKAIQDPANATATPAINKIPIADQTGGRLAWGWKSAFRGALVINNGQVSIPNNTTTIYVFSSANGATEEYDTDSIHDLVTNASRLIVPTGVTKVRLEAQINWSTNTTGDRTINFRKNGTNRMYPLYAAFRTASSISSTGWAVGPTIRTAVIAVAGGDYFELEVYQNSGAALYINNAYFAMEIVE